MNDLADADVLAHVLKYDSSHGVLDGDVDSSDGRISVDGNSFEVLSERDPTALPWADRGVDVVVESTGLFTDREGASQHLTAGAKKVVISAPATDPDITLVLGVNDDKYDPEQHKLISMASCTTNSVGPMAKILMDTFGIELGFMTTIHAYTTEQQLQDQIAVTRKGKVDLRRIRAAALFIIQNPDLPLLAWPREVVSGLVELEQGMLIFRQRHARMVERVIGRRTGTGGSAGVDYLDQTALRYRIFDDVWAGLDEPGPQDS